MKEVHLVWKEGGNRGIMAAYPLYGCIIDTTNTPTTLPYHQHGHNTGVSTYLEVCHTWHCYFFNESGLSFSLVGKAFSSSIEAEEPTLCATAIRTTEEPSYPVCQTQSQKMRWKHQNRYVETVWMPVLEACGVHL